MLEAAEEKADETLLTRIRGHDLFAREARFHKSCRAKYVSDPKHLRSTDDENRAQQQKLELAHRETYLRVCQKIDRDIICDKKKMKSVIISVAFRYAITCLVHSVLRSNWLTLS